jgi:imidazolonepropionase-like amidohydrolase
MMLFSGGAVFDGESRLPSGTAVLVDGAVIKRIAPEGEFAGYAGPRADVAGMTVLPGLIDCHVHLVYAGEAHPSAALDPLSPAQVAVKALHNAVTTLKGGITSVRDCGGKDYIEFAVRDACNAGTFLGPTIRAAGRMICMTGGHGNRIGRVADGVDDVVKAVREQVHAGSDFIKIMATGGVMTPGVNPEDAHYSFAEISAGIAEGHRFHKHCASHAQGAEGILNAVRGGIDSIEHGIFMDEECVEEMTRRGTFLVPTLAAVRNIVAGAEQGIPAFVVEKARRVFERHKQAIRTFHAAGGRIAMGTDAGTPFNRHGENALELRYMIDIGIPPADALKSATANAADLLRLADRGWLREGFAADLLVVAGDPLADIDAAAERRNHRWIVKNGQVIAEPGAATTASPALAVAAL